MSADPVPDRKNNFWSLFLAAASAIPAVLGVSVFGGASLFGGNSALHPASASDSSNTPTAEVAISQTCAGLAKRAVDAMDQGFLLDSERLQKMMSDLRCNRGGKP